MPLRTPILVGLVTVIATAGLSWFLLATSEDQYDEDNTYAVYADFHDAAGIRWKTRVQINGIDVGKIEDVRHVRAEDGQLVARVKIRILNEYEMFQNASIKKAAESLLGDYRLDLNPGTPGTGKLGPEGIIGNVQSLSDLDAIQSELKTVATNVSRVTDSLAAVLAGPEGEGSLKQILRSVERSMLAMERTTAAVQTTIERNERNINEMIADLTKFSKALGDVGDQDGDLRRVMANLSEMTDQLRMVSRDLSGVTDDSDMAEGRESLRTTIQRLNSTLENLDNVTRKLDEGDGSVGRLLNDDKLVRNVENTVENIGDVVGGLTRLKAEIELRSEYTQPLAGSSDQLQAAVKSYVGLRLFPRPDKYYLLELIDDPRGVQTRTQYSTTADGDTVVREVVQTEFNSLRFSAQFAKRYYFLTLRFGILESTGGVGANMHFFEDELEFRLDLFDFTRRDPNDNDQIFPRLRGFAAYEVYPHLYLQAGVDDPLNAPLRTGFFGGMIRFTDEDLRSILLVAPTP